jgi:copper chaperone CopZ
LARIRSILRGVDGIIGFTIVAEHTIRVTFDDLKTDQRKIIDALLQGGVTIPGKPEPITETPFSYK